MKTNCENNRKLSLLEHIQIRPTMYIGRLGDGTQLDDGIYILLKEVINNAVDELERRTDGQIEVKLLNEHRISIRDNGNGIPLDKLTQYVTIEEPIFDGTIGNKSIGLHGYGIKILIGLSSHFEVSSYNKGKARTIIFQNGLLKEDTTNSTNERDGLYVSFEPSDKFFKGFRFHEDIVDNMIREYSYLNNRLSFRFGDISIESPNGLADKLNDNVKNEAIYHIIHFVGHNIEVAFTHTYRSGETIFSYVNKHYTPLGGTHQEAFVKYLVQTMRSIYGWKKKDAILYGLVAAISIRVEDPYFDSSTKVKLSATEMNANGDSIDDYVGRFLVKHLLDYLYSHTDILNIIKATINEYR